MNKSSRLEESKLRDSSLVQTNRKNTRWVSRAANKLGEAVDRFGLARNFFAEKTVLDIGSSTGGFTELVLAKGARKVIAVEKGTRQMKAPLRFDPRVELHEKTDFFDFELEERVDIVVADVSFVSLRLILLRLKQILPKDAHPELLVMLKPQFEATEKQLVKGVVKNEKMRRAIIFEFENWLKRQGFLLIQKADNETRGKNGNRERFYYLRLAK